MSALSSLAGCSAALGAFGRTPSACGGVGGHAMVHWGGMPALQLAHDPTWSHGSGAQVQPRQQGVCLWASGLAAAQPANAAQLQCSSSSWRTSAIRSASRCLTSANSLAASASPRSTSRVYQYTSRPFCHLQGTTQVWHAGSRSDGPATAGGLHLRQPAAAPACPCTLHVPCGSGAACPQRRTCR